MFDPAEGKRGGGGGTGRLCLYSLSSNQNAEKGGKGGKKKKAGNAGVFLYPLITRKRFLGREPPRGEGGRRGKKKGGKGREKKNNGSRSKIISLLRRLHRFYEGGEREGGKRRKGRTPSFPSITQDLAVQKTGLPAIGRKRGEREKGEGKKSPATGVHQRYPHLGNRSYQKAWRPGTSKRLYKRSLQGGEKKRKRGEGYAFPSIIFLFFAEN